MLRQTMAEAVGNLAASRQRSVLALLGIFIGAGAVIAMLNVGAIARHETVQQFQDMGTDILTIRASQPQGLSLGDVEALPQAVPGLAVVAPFTTGNATAVFGETAQSASAVGVGPARSALSPICICGKGRFISDFDRYELYCVVGSNLAETLSSPVDRLRVGSELRVGRYVLRVVGILQGLRARPDDAGRGRQRGFRRSRTDADWCRPALGQHDHCADAPGRGCEAGDDANYRLLRGPHGPRRG